MVSLKHEGVLKLVRDRPAFAADLLGDLLDVKVPPFKLTDPARARREPQLAVLSVIAHGRGEVTTAGAIGVAAVRAVARLSEEQRMLTPC